MRHDDGCGPRGCDDSLNCPLSECIYERWDEYLFQQRSEAGTLGGLRSGEVRAARAERRYKEIRAAWAFGLTAVQISKQQKVGLRTVHTAIYGS